MRHLDSSANTSLLKTIQSEWSGKIIRAEENRNMVVVELDKSQLVALMGYLKDKHGFDMLMDLTAVDFLGKRDIRFEMVYMLFATKNLQRVRVKVPLGEGEKVPSLIDLWKGANWPEREVFDLMGIEFENHPLMERLIMPDGYIGNPLRKDFPLKGRGEDYLIESILLPVKQELKAK